MNSKSKKLQRRYRRLVRCVTAEDFNRELANAAPAFQTWVQRHPYHLQFPLYHPRKLREFTTTKLSEVCAPPAGRPLSVFLSCVWLW